ncbi:hypothetical protein BC829DRAFT_77154 [Chytridium lagenaria]|nr:hypothetical protein BC829DRAFT_77154 [Chytridium lagenaria]
MSWHPSVTQILLDHGADPLLRSKRYHLTALHSVCLRLGAGKLHLIDALTSPDVPEGWRTAQDRMGNTALHIAAWGSNDEATEACKMLVRRGIAWTIHKRSGVVAMDSLASSDVCKSAIKDALLSEKVHPSYGHAMFLFEDDAGIVDPKGEITTNENCHWEVQPLTMMCARLLRREKFVLLDCSNRVTSLVRGYHVCKTNGSFIPAHDSSFAFSSSGSNIFGFTPTPKLSYSHPTPSNNIGEAYPKMETSLSPHNHVLASAVAEDLDRGTRMLYLNDPNLNEWSGSFPTRLAGPSRSPRKLTGRVSLSSKSPSSRSKTFASSKSGGRKFAKSPQTPSGFSMTMSGNDASSTQETRALEIAKDVKSFIEASGELKGLEAKDFSFTFAMPEAHLAS